MGRKKQQQKETPGKARGRGLCAGGGLVWLDWTPYFAPLLKKSKNEMKGETARFEKRGCAQDAWQAARAALADRLAAD